MRISDWSSDVCSSDLDDPYREFPCESSDNPRQNGLPKRNDVNHGTRIISSTQRLIAVRNANAVSEDQFSALPAAKQQHENHYPGDYNPDRGYYVSATVNPQNSFHNFEDHGQHRSEQRLTGKECVRKGR